MKSILISNPVWGYENCQKFCDYSLKSLLSKKNLPELQKKYKVTLHILTKYSDHDFFKKNETFKSLSKKVKTSFYFFNDSDFTSNKYHKISSLQNLSINKSLDSDYIVFNYADFIWSDGSLSNSIETLNKSNKKFLMFFVLPVHEEKAKIFLKKTKKNDSLTYSNFSVNNLHREAKLRFWNNKNFTLTPTFIFFGVKEEGLVINAYHQTILAASTSNNNLLNEGIKGNSLDEYFSSKVAFDSYITNQDSNEIMVFALCDWPHDTAAVPKGFTREKAIKNCLRRINDSQRILARDAIKIKTVKRINQDKWSKVEKRAVGIIDDLNVRHKFNRLIFYIISHKKYGPTAQKLFYILSLSKTLMSKFFLLISWYHALVSWIFFLILLVLSKITLTKSKRNYPTNIKKYEFYRKFKINKILP